jgi:hypothetical protein
VIFNQASLYTSAMFFERGNFHSENAAFLEKGQLLFKQTLFHFKYAVSKGKKYIPTLESNMSL